MIIDTLLQDFYQIFTQKFNENRVVILVAREACVNKLLWVSYIVDETVVESINVQWSVTHLKIEFVYWDCQYNDICHPAYYWHRECAKNLNI